MKRPVRSVIPLLALILGAVFQVGISHAEAEVSPTLVATSIPPLACLVQRIGGSSIRTESILPVGANHETFEPGLAQLRSVLGAKIVFSTGHPYFSAEDIWVKRVLALDSRIPAKTFYGEVCGSTDKCPDPHFWVSPELYPQLLRAIATALKGVENNEKIIDNGFATTIAQFNESVRSAKQLLQPYQGRSFLTYHSSWHYFAKDFGLTELSIEKGGKEVGLAGLTTLTEQVKSAQINTLFVESVESSTGARNFAESNKLELIELNPISMDCADFPRLVALKLVNSFKRP